jgi:PAS domain S-box-containing protein
VAQDIQHLIEVLDALQCGAAIVDRAGTFVHVNPRLGEMFGLPREQIIGRSVKTFYGGKSEGWRRIRETLSHFDEPSEDESYIPRPDGSRLPVAIASKQVGDEPPLSDLRVATIVDLSAQKQEFQHVAELSDTILAQALSLRDYNKTLEEKVVQRTAELHEANMDAIYMLAVASEAKDEETGAHVRRIERFAESVAHALGLPADEARRLGYSAILHDVGKIHVPDHILKKPGPLTDDERQQMQTHTLAGETILSARPFFATARQIARSHHENWDGSGYPEGLSGAEIPLAARVVHVVDVFDALSSDRVYKPAWPLDRAAAHIEEHAGRLFDPEIARAFTALYRSGAVAEIRERR